MSIYIEHQTTCSMDTRLLVFLFYKNPHQQPWIHHLVALLLSR
jgi:hypothetical protein